MLDYLKDLKTVGDVVSALMAGAATLTLNEWAAILSITWWIYRFADDFYNKWKNSRKAD